MQIDKHRIESSLRSKGFEEDSSGDHRHFHHIYNGKKTGISTKTSHGSELRTYDDILLSKMKRQLRLDKQQLSDLLFCPMDGKQYNQILMKKGLLT